MPKAPKKPLQITLPKSLIRAGEEAESLSWWIEAYFAFEVTTLKSSQKVQRRDLATFLMFMMEEAGSDKLENWSPRLTLKQGVGNFTINKKRIAYCITTSKKNTFPMRTLSSICYLAKNQRTQQRFFQYHHHHPQKGLSALLLEFSNQL